VLTFDEIREDREKASKWLLGVAWLVEFCAAGIGFFIAFQVSADAKVFMAENNITSSSTNLAMLPFIIVGLVELTKIPLAYAVYHARVVFWRSLFAITLILLCFITTETIFTGMERWLNDQRSKISLEIVQQEQLKTEIGNISTNIQEIVSFDLAELDENHNKVIDSNNRNLNSRLDEIERTRSTKKNEINQKIQDQIDRFTNSQGTQLGELENQRQESQNKLGNTLNERDGEIARIRGNADGERKTQNKIISDSRQEISNLNQQEQSALEGVTFKGSIISSFKLKREQEQLNIDRALQKISEINTREASDTQITRNNYTNDIEKISTSIDDLSQQIKDGRASSEEGLEEALVVLNQQIVNQDSTSDDERSRATDFYASIEAQENKSYEREKAAIEKRREALPDLEANLNNKRDSLVEIERKINTTAEGIQVYRFAKWWGEHESLSDVTEEDIGLVTGIWFGSISLIAAITGTVIAFGSFVLKDRDAFTPREKKKPRKLISRSIRRLIINRRRFYRRRRSGIFSRFIDSISDLFTAIKDRLYRPVIKKEYIEKEVEVEKIIEVPKEIIRKEMVYVPFYSTEGGTLDISGQIKDMTNPEDIKQKISEITSSMTSEKEDE
jgi:hypothetical protein